MSAGGGDDRYQNAGYGRADVDSGSERKGVYSPAWIFYGKVIEHHKSYNEYTDKWDTNDMQEQQPWIVLAINAVDGSVIDVVEGY